MPGPLAQSHSLAYGQIATLAERVVPASLTPAQAVFAVTPGGTHILWLLGHVAIATESYIGGQVGFPKTVPAEWAALFGMGSKALPGAAAYPAYEELRRAAISCHGRMAEHLETLEEAEIARALPPDSPLGKMAPNVGAHLSFGQLHSNYHLGQITILLRAQGLDAGVGL